MTETMVDTMNCILYAMNQQMQEWRERGAVTFENVPVGARFVWTAVPEGMPQKPKTRTKSGYRLPGSPVFRTGRRTLCYIVE